MCRVRHLILSILIFVDVHTGRQIQSAGLPTNYQNDPVPNYEYGPPLIHHNDPPPNYQDGVPPNYQNVGPPYYPNGPPPNYQDGVPPNYQNVGPPYYPNGPPPNYRNSPPLNYQNAPPPSYQAGPTLNYQDSPSLNYQNSSYLRSLKNAVTAHETQTAAPTRHYEPNYGYKEYWPGGQWVLYSTQIGAGRTTTTKSMPTICGMECPAAFHNVGPVCGRWSTVDNTGTHSCAYSWDNPTPEMKRSCHNWYPDDYSEGYQTYPSYCSFLNTECTSAKNFKNETVLVFVHGGPCKEQATYFLAMGGDRYKRLDEFNNGTQMQDRIEQQIIKMNNRFKQWDRTPWAISK